MSITSIQLGRGGSFLDLMDGVHYMVGRDTLIPLVSTMPYENVIINMAGRSPVPVRQQVTARPIPLIVYLLKKASADRWSDYNALASYLDTTTGLVQLRWLDGATWKRYWCLCTNVQPTAWYQRVGAELIAPNPVAETF